METLLNYELLRTQSFVLTVGSIISVVLVLLGTLLALRVIAVLLRQTMRRRAISEGRQASFLQLVAYVIWTFGVIFAIQALGLDITFLLASSAALLVGIGLGLQGVFKDFICGIIILLDGTVKSGDVVDVNGLVVRILDVAMRSSIAITREDNIVIIPNHKFIEENVINWTHNGTTTRFHLDVGVDYSSDPRQVEQILIDCAMQSVEVKHEAPHRPFVRLMNFGASSLDFQLVFWSDELFRIESVKSRLRFRILDSFREQGIAIPFQQVVVHGAVS